MHVNLVGRSAAGALPGTLAALLKDGGGDRCSSCTVRMADVSHSEDAASLMAVGASLADVEGRPWDVIIHAGGRSDLFVCRRVLSAES